MHKNIAISLEDVSKTYRLYGSQREQLCDALGLARIGLARPSRAQQFKALSNISLEVPKGHRIGIIGRNGAGKTTLLKLICGNFTPTSGKLTVNGMVQALMSTGLGFHPEFTGFENIRSSLQYNGLAANEYQQAVDDIIEFCELGEFIHQPFKTYSLGMQARLMFAAATAIRPDILIIDEVLGAGDAYFIAKSRQRVENLVNSGATMLLVSHSTQQVLELCNEAIWLHEGKIRMQGDAFSVVKAYEEYIHNPALLKRDSRIQAATPQAASPAVLQTAVREVPLPISHRLQEPYFQPQSDHVEFAALPHSAHEEKKFPSAGGVSHWEGEPGVKVCGFTIQTAEGESNRLQVLQPAAFTIFTRADISGPLELRYGIAVHNLQGMCMIRIFSPIDAYEAIEGEIRKITIVLNPNQLGPGEYILGISVNAGGPLEQINAATRYDLVARSFSFCVEVPDSLQPTAAALYHSAEWTIAPV